MVDVMMPISADTIPDPSPRPVVVHVHGGGWQRGDRKNEFYGGPFMGRSYAQRGFVSVVVSYRVGVAFPQPIEDVAHAVKWTVDFIDTYGGDPNNIFLSGHSAGGHLVSLLVSHPEYLRSVKVPLSIIKGVICISGIYTVANPLSENPCDLKNVFYRQFYVNRTFGTNPQDWLDASPSHHILSRPSTIKQKVQLPEKQEQPDGTEKEDLETSVKEYFPAFCLFNAKYGDLGLDFDGRKFHDLLKQKGIRSEYYSIEGAAHPTITISKEVVDKCTQFIHEVLNSKGHKQ